MVIQPKRSLQAPDRRSKRGMASPFRTNDLPGLPDDPEERELFEQYVLKVREVDAWLT